MRLCLLLPFLLLPVVIHTELPELKPLLGERGEIVFSANFDAPSATPPKSKLGKTAIVNGALRIEERAEDHHQAAVSLYPPKGGPKPYTDFILQADFQWNGATDFQIGFNRVPELVKKAADGTPAAVSAHALTVEFRQSTDPKKPHDWLVDDVSNKPWKNIGKHPITLERGRWYRILIEVRGNEVAVQLSNGQTIRGTSTRPNDLKAAPIFRARGAAGHGMLFDNVTLWTLKQAN